jgi:Fe2+ or Zn2+ uptake regulation protein
MHLEGEKHFYEVKTKRDHVHLACFCCGRIEEFSSPFFEGLKAEISKQAGFTIRVTRLEVGGNCRACAGRMSTEQANGDAPTAIAFELQLV